MNVMFRSQRKGRHHVADGDRSRDLKRRDLPVVGANCILVQDGVYDAFTKRLAKPPGR